MSPGRSIEASLAALVLALAAQSARAEDIRSNPVTPLSVDDIIVTGTRDYNVKARESTAPVTVLGSNRLAQTGANNLFDALQKLDPSFSFSGFGTDLDNLVRKPRLRGLTANHVLVLVNGKRRHGTANMGEFSNIGSSGVDLEQIPVSAIDHIEILEDGAAAQYGSDAIAGVINIILKNSPDSGEISALIGSYGPSYNANTHGNGLTRTGQVDKGFALGDNGFLHLSTDITSHLHSNQSGRDTAFYSASPRVGPGTPFPWLNPDTVGTFFSDAAYIRGAAGVNAGYKFDNGAEAYLFGTVGRRRAESFQSYGTPTLDGALPQILSASGFQSAQTIHETDWSVTGGLKGSFLADGHWDLSLTYGADIVDVGANDTANASLFDDRGWTPRQFHIGQYSNSQRTINLDFIKPVSLSFWSSAFNIAFGAENRRDTYRILSGDVWSYYGAGAAVLPGIRPTDASDHSRNSFAAYVDVSNKPLPQWKLDIAGRYETYSDFGDTVNGKLSTRYDITPQIAARGTVSTGFRAPTLSEEYYSKTQLTPPLSANVVLPPNSAAAALAGAQPLKPEKSTNVTVGLVLAPLQNLHASIDAYQIDLRDRIVTTGSLSGSAADAAIAASGNTLGYPGFVNYFVNGADTRTRGVDLKADYSIDVGSDGSFRFDFAASFFDATILRVANAPATFNGAPLLDAKARSFLTDTVPHEKIIFGGSYLRDAWTFTLHFTHYGWVTQVTPNYATGGAPYSTSINSPKLITDLEIGYDFDFGLHAAIGGNNVFGVRPDVSPFYVRFNNANTTNNMSPYGINGGYYYARASWKF
ncbi:TonB-dependent siderophore receptor [Methylosinus sp. Sm6]|uniref:TonB-dependent receptor plug domain-containing protein n=1 Tax=Methylosinus sp. Sm6 TaxID=2866948 RepID=UPI001C99A957|nr:TonB-dependent receptor [Methylosinus sp. Sm6]MBY6242633.1 TonB-dependent receptor [Methylosinus sp. Sm6]